MRRLHTGTTLLGLALAGFIILPVPSALLLGAGLFALRPRKIWRIA